MKLDNIGCVSAFSIMPFGILSNDENGSELRIEKHEESVVGDTGRRSLSKELNFVKMFKVLLPGSIDLIREGGSGDTRRYVFENKLLKGVTFTLRNTALMKTILLHLNRHLKSSSSRLGSVIMLGDDAAVQNVINQIVSEEGLPPVYVSSCLNTPMTVVIDRLENISGGAALRSIRERYLLNSEFQLVRRSIHSEATHMNHKYKGRLKVLSH